MFNNDSEILDLILQKEGIFVKEIADLADLLETNGLSAEISDYLSGLRDLKNDFLLPARIKTPAESETAATFLADKTWHCQRA